MNGSSDRWAISGIYVITDNKLAAGRGHLAVAEAAVQAGVRIVQLRDESLCDRELLEIALAVRRITSDSDTCFLVNNRTDTVLASGADGVHVGQDDLPVDVVRRIVGPDAIVGVSTANVEEAAGAQAQGASYVAIGPIFRTTTKVDAGEAVGLEAISAIKRAVSIPVVAIGGINPANIASVAAAGADAAAVISAVADAEDITTAVQTLQSEFLRGWKEAK